MEVRETRCLLLSPDTNGLHADTQHAVINSASRLAVIDLAPIGPIGLKYRLYPEVRNILKFIWIGLPSSANAVFVVRP